MPKFKVGDKIALAKVEYRTVLEVVQAGDGGYLIKRPYRPFESSILSHSLVDIDNNYELVETPEISTIVDPDGFDIDDPESPINALAKAEERVRELEFALKNLSDECLIIAEALNDYPPCTQPSMSRNDASRNLKQWVSDTRAALEGK